MQRELKTEFELAIKSGANLLQELQQIRKIVREMSAIEPEVLCSALALKNEHGEGRDRRISVDVHRTSH